MKNSTKFIMISGLMYASNSFGLQTIDANEKPIPSSGSCEVIINTVIYGEKGGRLFNLLTANDNDIIVSHLSSVTAYNPDSKVFIDNNFVQPSNYAPKNGTYVVAWQNGKTKLNIKNLTESDRDKVVAQVRFFTRRASVSQNGLQIKTDFVSAKLNENEPTKLIITNHGFNSKHVDANLAVTSTDCLNILPRWCGDGVVDVSEGEICDDGNKNGLLGQCSTSCKK